jgi:hypothetical protein
MILAGIVGAIAGGGIGYLVSRHMSKFTGGVCPIFCNPKISVPYFAFLGMIIAGELLK